MKCIAAVVMMALAVVAEANTVAYSVPLAYSAPHTTVVQQNVAPRYVASVPVTYAAAPVAYSAYSGYTAPVATTYVQNSVVPQYAAPVAYAAAPVATVVAQPAVAVYAQKEARYVAANRGAVHDAPLAGHAVSQQSLNLEPAAGTV
ncbi:hypothetical protein pipiens_012337 [Culex pipiens pipiens]|uniref:Cuticle protein n=1 Tax=Culex pipiens pipiens TaxID=38569 RepID=A0ABD1D2N7_CULPP